MSMQEVLFYTFALLASVAAFAILFIRNVFYAAMLLLVCLLALAGIYILATAEFVAVTQILIYAGGILVVIIFGIMLTGKTAGRALVVSNSKWFGGLLAGVFFLSLLLYLYSKENFAHPGEATLQPEAAIHTIGIEIMTDYVVPFELAGVVLLIALIGAAVMAANLKKE